MTRHLLFVLTAMLLTPLYSAQARPRDDVMAELFHCNGLQSDRQWLDCYYGVAQPVRAALGLKPALSNQVRLAQSPPAGSPARPSDARSRVIADAGNCYNEVGEGEWLDCYYRAAQPMRDQLGLAPSSATPAAPPPAVTNFGNIRPVDNAPVRQLVSRMASYSFDPHMVFTVALANGQTWQQIEGDTDAARWKKPPASYVVIIRRGVSGSFILTVRNEPHSFRVRRVD
jgi:hypothetical protein